MADTMSTPFPRNMLLMILTVLCIIVNAVHPQMQEPTLSPCEMESLLRQLTNPDEGNEMHAAALRQQLRDLMENTEQYDYQTYNPQVDLIKRSLSSIARSGVRYGNGKRNIGALARQGMLRASDLEQALSGSTAAQKRSLATLAKNGQLPASTLPSATDRDADEGDEFEATPLAQQWKRNMAALARAGLLGSGRLADNNEAEGKRGGYPYWDKRNVGTLARDWTLPTSQSNRLNVQKRNIGSMKNSPVHGKASKVKRAAIAYDEYPSINVEQLEPVYQTAPVDYSELAKYINQLYYVPSQFADDFDSDLHLKKRYLGSMMRDGWSSSYQAPPAKRNIGALARMGLLRTDTNSYGQLRSHGGRQQQRLAEKRHLGSLARTYHTANARDNTGPAAPPVNVVQHPSSQPGQPGPAASPAAGPSPAALASAAASMARPPPAASRESTAAAYADPFTRPAITTEQLYARYALPLTANINRNIPPHPLTIINHPFDRYRYANNNEDVLLNDVVDNDDNNAVDNRLDNDDNIGSDGWEDGGDGYLSRFAEPLPPMSTDYYNEAVQDQCLQRLRKLAQLF